MARAVRSRRLGPGVYRHPMPWQILRRPQHLARQTSATPIGYLTTGGPLVIAPGAIISTLPGGVSHEAISAADIKRLLEADSTIVRCSVDLLDADHTWIADITDDVLADDAVHLGYDSTRTLPFEAAFSLLRELQWQRHRVRFSVRVTSIEENLTKLWTMGVFCLTYPSRQLGTTPEIWAVHAMDQMLRVDQEVGRTYEMPAGTDVRAEVTRILVEELGEVHVRIDPPVAGATTTLADNMVWLLSDKPTWRQVTSEALAAVGFRPLTTDRDGWARSGPHVEPVDRPVSWVFDADSEMSIVGPGRTLVNDLADVPNVGVFYAKTSSRDTPLGEDNGIYRVVNQSDGPTSIDARGGGRLGVLQRSYPLDAVDQVSLVAQADQIVAADKAKAATLGITSALVPVLWDGDVIEHRDNQLGGADRWLVEKWEADLTARSMEMSVTLRKVG